LADNGARGVRTHYRFDPPRETVITTVQAFQQMEDPQPNLRDNTILLIDEAHRSQEGKGAFTRGHTFACAEAVFNGL
jgi:type I site-specific restriction-modification system R (restriction) subunit